MQPKAIINLKSFSHNIHYIKSIINHDTNIMPVIKANAYGHGYREIVEVLIQENIHFVCVATINEVNQILELNSNINILHMGRICLDRIEIYACNNIVATINSKDDVTMINKLKIGKIRCHIKVDTGMNRMGCSLNELDSIIDASMQSDYIKLEGIYSHLASSYNIESKHNKFQINNFNDIIIKYKKNSFYFHLLSSGGLINFPDYHLNGVRCGLSLYGISPLEHISEKLKPVMKLIAPIVLVKHINKDEKVGYDCTFIAEKDMRIALVHRVTIHRNR